MHGRGIDIVAGMTAVLVAISAASQATGQATALAVGSAPTFADRQAWTGERTVWIAGSAEPAVAMVPRWNVAQASSKGAQAATRVDHPVIAASRAVARLIGTDADAGSFAAHALALRAAIVKGGGEAVLSRIPGGLSQRSPPEMWPAFFRNAMVALGRLRSPGRRRSITTRCSMSPLAPAGRRKTAAGKSSPHKSFRARVSEVRRATWRPAHHG